MKTETKTDILQLFIKMNIKCIDEEGITIPQAIMVDAADGLVLMAMACPAKDIPMLLRKQLTEKAYKSFIFGSDRFLKDEQGTEYKDGLSVTYFDGTHWNFGIMEYKYQKGLPPLVKPINWGNPFWKMALHRESSGVFGSIDI